MPSRPTRRLDLGKATLFRNDRGRVGSHYTYLDAGSALAPEADPAGALGLLDAGWAFRRTGLAGAILRLRVDRPDMLRIDWRPGRAVGWEEAAETLTAAVAGLDRPRLLRRAGALDGGIRFSRPLGRHSPWMDDVRHHPDALSDAIGDALAGRFIKGCIASLGREPGPDARLAKEILPQGTYAPSLHATAALRAALSDAAAFGEAGADGLAPLLTATRAPFERRPPEALYDADLPDWVLDLPTDALPLPPKAAELLARRGAVRLGDLAAVPAGLLAAAGLNEQRTGKLRDLLDDLAVQASPVAADAADAHPRVHPGGTAPTAGDASPSDAQDAADAFPDLPEILRYPLLPLLLRRIAALPDRHKPILKGLAGLDATARTLHPLAAEVGYAPERLRQVSERFMRLFCEVPAGLALGERIAAILPVAPVRLTDLAREPWAVGMPLDALRFLIRNVPGHPLLSVGDAETGDDLIVPMSASGWNTAVRDGRRALSRMPPRAPRKAMAHAVMNELIGLNEAQKSAVIAYLMPPGFVPPPPSTSITVRAILQDATEPMTLDEIRDAYAEAMGHPATTIQIRHALNNLATRDLSNRYALPTVFEDDERLRAIADGCDRVMRKAGGLRHWTTLELSESLPRQHAPVLSALGERGLAMVLRDDGRFRMRKSGTWILSTDKAHARPTTDAWAESVVAEAGRPVCNAELAATVIRTRGQLANIQFREHGRMVRDRAGSWCLYDRDLGLTEADVSAIHARIRAAVAQGPRPLRVIHDALAPGLPEQVTVRVLQSLMALDPGGPRTGRDMMVRPPGMPAEITSRLAIAIVEASRETQVVEDVIRAVRKSFGRSPSYKYVQLVMAEQALRTA